MMVATTLRKIGASGYSLAELRRVCALIEASPPGKAPDMRAIYAAIDRERVASAKQTAPAAPPEQRALLLIKRALCRPVAPPF
jgi:hypothetical protein